MHAAFIGLYITAPVDYILLVFTKELIAAAKRQTKDAYIAFLDVTKLINNYYMFYIRYI